MRLAFLAALVFASLSSAAELPLPDWATPGTQTRSVREAMAALHSAGVSFQDFGDYAAASVWQGELTGSWVFSGGSAGGPPTRYHHYVTANDGSGKTQLSVVCEDTPEACRAHMEALRGEIPPPVPPPPPPPPHLAAAGPGGWMKGPQGFFPARGQKPTAPDPGAAGAADAASPPQDAPLISYPVEPWFGGVSGSLLLRVTIDDTGRVMGARIMQSSRNWAMDRAAIDQSREWKFRPGIRNGVPVGGDVLVPVKFSAPEGPRGPEFEARREIPIGELKRQTARKRPWLDTPATITTPDEAWRFMDQACRKYTVESNADHKVMVQRGPESLSYWTFFDDSSPMKGGVVRRRLVTDGDTPSFTVSYVCNPDPGACEALEQYLESNLRDLSPQIPASPPPELLRRNRCDPR